VATVTPRKGYELLLTALAAIPQRNWRLTCAGSLDRDPATVARVRAQLRDSGLEDRVSLAGDMDATALGAQYDRADLFVLPTLYEGYGMAVAEALARGLPVISTATGAIEDLVLGNRRVQPASPEPGRTRPDDAAGIIVPPGDLPAFTDALFRVVGDANLRSRLAANARRARQRLPTWEAAAAAMAEALEASSRGDEAPMAGFSAEWLALREPVDHAARSLDLTRALLATLPGDRPLGVLDLGAGSGSNLRYLLDAATRRADFLLIDHDPALLALIPKAPWIQTRCMDLATLGDPTIFDGREVVTASALLDLVSDQWLQALAALCAARGAAVLFALTYDGLIGCSPEDPDDGLIVALVNEHQRTDKGFGPALGPDAPGAAARCFEQFGYKVQRARSDWRLASDRRELQRRLIEGWAQAATEIAPARARVVDGWRDRRLAHVAAGWSEIVVGHEDFAAFRSRV
jgi:predicted O-methyltransferase YrrM